MQPDALLDVRAVAPVARRAVVVVPVPGVARFGGHSAQRVLRRRDQGRTLVDERPHRRETGRPDDLGGRDERAEPVRDVDDPLARDTREEVLVAAGHADDLVRQDRPDHERDVVVDDGPVQQHLHLEAHPALGQLLDPGGGNGAEMGEGLRLPPLVVTDLRPRIDIRQCPSGVAEVGSERVGVHRRVRPQRDQHGEPRHPPVQSPVDGADEQRERERARPVRHQHADGAPVGVDARQLLLHEPADLLLGKDPVRPADAGGRPLRDVDGRHEPTPARARSAHSKEMQCDSIFDPMLRSSTSIMKSP